MSDNSEEHQSLDIGVLRYTSDEIGIRQSSNDIPDKITTRVGTQDILVDDSNPTELYLYDQPQENLRQADNEAPVESHQPFITAALNYDEKNDTVRYNNDISGNINTDITANGDVNGSPGSIHYDRDDSNLDSQSTLTPLKQRDRQDYIEDHHHSQVLGIEGLQTTNTTTTSSESSIPASQEMQSSDALLTRTNFDIRGVNEVGDSAEQPFYVNAKQYYRILKRRYTRAKLEENLRISRERRPYLHESRHKHAMRRPRGQGGRFLTLAEIEAMKSKESSVSSSSSASSTPNVKNENDQMASAPRLVEKRGTESKPKMLRPADGSSR